MASAEFTLAVECCRFAYSGEDGDRIGELARAVDWPRFIRLARFHRVQGLLWRSLSAADTPIPGAHADTLSRDATDIAAANLRSAAEASALLGDFQGAKIPLLFVKGLTLGVLAYGNASTKSGIDIDLLIPPGKVREAGALLTARGYQLVIPRGDLGRLEAWHRHRKESVWFDPKRDLQVDLHTRLGDQPQLIPSIGLNSPTQSVEVASGISVPTLTTEELFAYLAVHGASSAWFRLKWITDVAALIHPYEASEIGRFYRRSQELGAGRAAAQALLLANTLYATLEALAPLRRELERDPANRWLHAAALKQLAGRADPIEPTSRLFGTGVIHLSQLALLPGWRFKASELARQARIALS